MSIKAIPIPFGELNASQHIEHFNKTLREEALTHFIFLGGVQHDYRLVA
ncbi:MAG: hypothetical protein KJ970_13725 [Candidatus Eisenbacteria bacterium]|uniref:Uncharacterized protein n=1 Tax=Eiseniibacteriota bacterium TaxID=2212470 RepID=A0A948W6W9_UNCEI|nr:hypothetical protein [Candidatus Eisenbacteria bacterium]MBU1950722.1 hypothetical protein [Candidatus Eisenbacteria bacterium]MBU2691974.1 hypothetical protein [Candidatus Eisenbacteria bacterium]